jgi:hypothetical protein
LRGFIQPLRGPIQRLPGVYQPLKEAIKSLQDAEKQQFGLIWRILDASRPFAGQF